MKFECDLWNKEKLARPKKKKGKKKWEKSVYGDERLAEAWEAVARAAPLRCGGNDADNAGAVGWPQIPIGFQAMLRGWSFSWGQR